MSAKTAVLVHGAFADGSSWNRVIPILEDAGLDVIAVQNPLESLEGDVAFTNRAIERAEGPVVLVGHSWGGVVITEAGVHDKVQSLVYVAAYAPGEGESLGDVASAFPTAPGIESLVPDSRGYLSLPDGAVKDYFAQDLPEQEASAMAVTQGALNSAALSERVTNVAWKTKPSWYAVSENDHMTPSELQRDLVERIGATSVSLDSSHVSMLSQPEAVAQLILDAAA